jgi:hypothetical protein
MATIGAVSRRRRAPPSQVAGLIGAAAVAVAIALAAPAGARGVANDVAEGRKHAERASHLAAKGKCGQALGEYDKAIAVLHDPTLLFNRGECHRKLGNAESALEDYNQFLSDLPNAPNRAQVEERIAELRAQQSSNDAPAARGASGAASPLSRPDPRNSVVGASPPAAAAPPPARRLDVAPPPASEVAPPPVLASPAEPRPSEGSPSSEARAGSLSGRPWFWVALGAVVVGAGVGAYFVLGRDPTNVPRSDLGNYRF